ncbi:MAG: DegV family protein [Oscillospiraceae bacterium]
MANQTAYQITADSACDLPLALCRERGILPCKMTYTMDGVVMTDEMNEESCNKFYSLMRAGGTPATSQINPGTFMDFWRPLAEAGRPVLHISLAASVSGSYESALTAVGMLQYDYPAWDCRVIDSINGSTGTGLLVLRAAANRDNGLSLDENACDIVGITNNVNSIFTTDTLKYLHRGGRLSRSAAIFGTALNIQPIMHVHLDGHIEVWKKVRGEKQCKQKIIDLVKELAIDAPSQTLMVSHADDYAKALEYGEALKAEVGFRDVYYSTIGPTIGAHAGPGLIAVFFTGKER